MLYLILGKGDVLIFKILLPFSGEMLPVCELNLTTFPWLMRVGGGNFNVGGSHTKHFLRNSKVLNIYKL